MESEKIPYHKRRWFTVSAVLLTLVLLIVGIRFALKSDWLLNQLRMIAENKISDSINGDVTIGAIRGDLLKGITVYDFRLQDEELNTIASIDSLSANYAFLKLISKPVKLDQLYIYGLYVSLEEDENKNWNVAGIIPEEDEPEEVVEPFFWQVNDIRLTHSAIDIKSYSLPDTTLKLSDLSLNSSVSFQSSGWEGSLRDLTFNVEGTRFAGPVEFGLDASAANNTFTLEKLVIGTGRTLLESNATLNEALTEISGEMILNPLAWLDMASYADDVPLERDLSVQLSAAGSLEDLQLNITARAAGLESIHLKSLIHLNDDPSISLIEITMNSIDLPVLTGIENTPFIGNFAFNGEGDIRFNSIEESTFDGDFTLNAVRIDTFSVDRIHTLYSLAGSKSELFATLEKNQQEIIFTAQLEDPFSNLPHWNMDLESDALNLGELLQNPEYDSELNLRASLTGRGYGLTAEPIMLNTNIVDSRYGDQPFSLFSFDGWVTVEDLTGELDVRIDQSRVHGLFSAVNWQNIPVYEFDLDLEEFNMAELTGLEDFPTYLNATLDGNGRYFNLENLELIAAVQFDSSIVNSEPIQKLQADFQISNRILTVSDAALESPIADGNFTARQNLSDYTDLNNSLDFDLLFKDTNALAPLFGLENLRADGTLTGRMGIIDDGILEFDGNLNLQDIIADTLITVEQLSGDVRVKFFDEPEVNLSMLVTRPTVSEITIQEIRLSSISTIAENRIHGSITANIEDNETAFRHSGTYSYTESEINLLTESLQFQTPVRTLSLQNSFELLYADKTLTMEPLKIASEDNQSHLIFEIVRIDEFFTHFNADARLLNLGSLQQTFMEEPIFEAYATGNLEFVQSTDSLFIQSRIQLEQLQVNDGEMDSLAFNIDLSDEILNFQFDAWHLAEKIAEGETVIPFKFGDPSDFEPAFFENNVSGYFELFQANPSYLSSLLGQDQISEGLISLRADVAGTAGSPALTGNLNLTNTIVSGVSIDSTHVDFNYEHENSEVNFDGYVISLGNRVAEFTASLPLHLDLQKLEVILPEESDEVFVDINTNDFNLALFNEFADRDLIRDIRGRLNGNIILSGELAELEATGRMSLSGGNLRIIPVNITLSGIESQISFMTDRLLLDSFSMNSGPGRFTASGELALNDLVPGDMSLEFNANQFRIANTSDANAIIDLNGKLTGTILQPDLNGQINFRSGFINLQNFGEQSVETVVLEDEDEPLTFAFYDSLSMEMDVIFSRQFFVRNRQFLDMEIVLGGQVDLLKERNQELQMFGTLEGVSGYARPLGKNFILEEGTVAFYGPVEDPQLNIRTSFTPPQPQADVQIWYIIEGTLQDPEFRFDSEPYLELQDIISYTLFGQPFYALDSWQQVVSGSGGTTATDVAMELLLDRVESIASQQLGIDVVQIDNSRSGSNSTTSIKTGWYINNRTFFAILNEISSTTPKTLFILEYMLRENLELIITQGDDSREGIDLRWKYDY
jgi:autotransporter translocation and assembly factor TamB